MTITGQNVFSGISSVELAQAVKESTSILQVLKKFGLDKNRGSYITTLKRRLIRDGIDFSHIPAGKSHNKKRATFFVKDIEVLRKTYLIENSKISRGSVKRFLIKTGLLESKCFICGNKGVWEGKTLILVLDHINGVNNDNRVENLRLLCPNCNSQTETFSGKNAKLRRGVIGNSQCSEH